MTTPFPFTLGQTLTAAQMNAITELVVNDKTASHTLTAADAGDRVIMNSASATTITVDTSIFTAGQVIYVTNKGAGVCTITAGTATVSTTGTLALSQFASGVLYCISAGVFLFEAYGVAAAASGLTFITSASVSAALTLTVSNVFSATFANYLMTYTNVTLASLGNIGIQMATGGTANTNANYQIGSFRVSYTAGAGNAGGQAVNQTTFSTVITDLSATPGHGSFNFYGPFATQQTGITTLNAGGNQSQFMGGVFTATTSFDGVKLTASQNMTGTFRFYGIVNS